MPRILWSLPRTESRGTGDRMKISYCEKMPLVPEVLKILCVQGFFSTAQWHTLATSMHYDLTSKDKSYQEPVLPRTHPIEDMSLTLRSTSWLKIKQPCQAFSVCLQFDNSVSSYYLGHTSSSLFQTKISSPQWKHILRLLRLVFLQFCWHHLQFHAMQVPQSPEKWSFFGQSLTPEGLTGTAY